MIICEGVVLPTFSVAVKYHQSHLFAEVVCPGVTSPGQYSVCPEQVAQVSAPAVALGLRTLTASLSPGWKLQRVRVVADVPIGQTMVFAVSGLIVSAVLVAWFPDLPKA